MVCVPGLVAVAGALAAGARAVAGAGAADPIVQPQAAFAELPPATVRAPATTNIESNLSIKHSFYGKAPPAPAWRPPPARSHRCGFGTPQSPAHAD